MTMAFKIWVDVKNYSGKGPEVIAYLVDEDTNSVLADVVYDEELYQKKHYHFCSGIDPETNYFTIYMDRSYLNILIGQKDVFICLILHEYGHYNNGDFTGKHTTTEIRMDRTHMAIAGIADPREVAADAFVANIMGRDMMIKSLRYLTEKRKQRNDSGANLAIKEFELRIKALKQQKKLSA